MAQRPIELILVRQLAEGLVVPVFLVDAAGDLIFFNEPAGRLLGLRFEEVGEMPFETWTSVFEPRDPAGHEQPPGELPLAVAIRDRHPAHASLRIVGQDSVARSIEVTAFPLEGPGGQLLGGVAMFWESDG